MKIKFDSKLERYIVICRFRSYFRVNYGKFGKLNCHESKCRIIKTCGVYLLFTHNKFKKQGMQMMFFSFISSFFSYWFFQLHFRFCIALDSHSIDSSNPSPFIALALKIWNVRFFNASSPNALWTSVTDMAPSMSCLLANTTKIAPFNSSSWNIDKNRKNHTFFKKNFERISKSHKGEKNRESVFTF